MDEESSNPEDIAEDIIDAIDEESDEEITDGLTKKEREIEVTRAYERKRKAQELKKIYLFPVIAGIFMILLSYFAYRKPRYTWLALIPASMLGMAGGTVYFLITFAVTVDPSLDGLIYATPTPLSMIIAGVIALLAIALREKED